MNDSFSKLYKLLTSSNRSRALFLFVLILIGAFFEALGVGMVLPVLALLMDSNLAGSYPVIKPVLLILGEPDHTTQIQIMMFFLIIVYFIKNLYLSMLAWLQTQFSFSLQRELSKRLFSIYLKQPYTFHLQKNSSQLFRNITSEVNEVVGRGVTPVMSLLAEFLVLLSIMTLLLIAEPIGAMVVFSVLFVFAWGFYWLTKVSIKNWGEKRMNHNGLRVQHLNQGLAGVKDIKLLGREAEFLVKFNEHTEQQSLFTQYVATIQKMPRLFLELLVVAGLVLLVLTMVSNGTEVTQIVPIAGLFGVAAFRLMPSINRIITDVQSLRFGFASINKLSNEFQLPIVDSLIKRSKTSEFMSNISLNDVTYSYPERSEKSLSSINLQIKRGELVGIIGPSGCGKSTLIDVILGLLLPVSGEVSFDDIDININIRDWQDRIGYVPQSIYFTDDTLRRNIAFGVPEDKIDDAAVSRAIRSAQLGDFVSQLQGGIATIVGERGVRLSGGQRQRIGIARALYHDPDILVLDEATSALDTETEGRVMEAITKLHGKKTIIVVAHRLSTLEECDRVYRLEQGKIVQEGKPSEILLVNNVDTLT